MTTERARRALMRGFASTIQKRIEEFDIAREAYQNASDDKLEERQDDAYAIAYEIALLMSVYRVEFTDLINEATK